MGQKQQREKQKFQLRWTETSQRYRKDIKVDRHGQRATHPGIAAAFVCSAHCCVCVRSCLPGDALAGSTCTPGTSHPVQSELGPTKQNQTRSGGAGQKHQKENLLCSNSKEGQPSQEEGHKQRGPLSTMLPTSPPAQKGMFNNPSTSEFLIAAIKILVSLSDPKSVQKDTERLNKELSLHLCESLALNSVIPGG